MKEQHRLATVLSLIGILLIGAFFRFTGLGWGEGQPIHPDEEFLRQVVAVVQLPNQPGLYLDTANSPLNPYNRGYGFFVYGTLPLFVTRAVAEGLDQGCEPPYSLPARLLAPAMLGRPVEKCAPGAFSGGGARTVGRALAALFDLGGLLFIFLAGRRIGPSWLGLLAALLYAVAVLPIQQAHFFTVDAFANFFVAVTLYLVLRAAETGGWGAFALAGLATGLGMACKISVWPLGLLVALAAVVWWWRKGEARQRLGESKRPQGALLLRLLLAGGMALLAFRLAQPYAFMGPGLLGLQLNPQWLKNMAEIRRLVSGAVDTYPGHQWTNRTPLVFPWVNMVFWGLGLPLGMVAWIGWLVAGVDLVLRWRRERAVPPLFLIWVWGTGYFLYQGTQWVKSMRYLLPVYPAFVLLAGWLVMWLGRRRHKVGPYVAAGVAVVGGVVWAVAFLSVYTRSHTRIAASRWIFRNVPTAATVHLRTAGADDQVQVALAAGTVTTEGAQAVFQVDREADLTGVTLNYVVDASGDPEPEQVRLAVTADPDGRTVLAEATASITPPPLGVGGDRHGQSFTFALEPQRLLPGTTYYLIVETVEGGPIQLFTSVLATEHWDWPPPLRVDGRDPFGGMYRGLSTSSDGTLQLYHDDTPEKREGLLNWLDEADYIIIGSNRLYASIPRLPTRYPLTIAYYQALFSGELGFELMADFTSYPALGPFQFPDTEEPFPVPEAAYQYRSAPISVPLPPAEEAFSVYDHPRVLVFRKTPAYSRQRAEAALPASLLEHVVWVTPRQATRGVREAVLDPETWAQQQAGGTWSAMFDRESPVNRSSTLAAVVWYLTAAALGWAAFPLLFAALPRLQDRGYGLARPLGLLMVAYLTWLSASLRLLPNTRGTVLLSVLLLAGTGGMVAWRRGEELRGFLRGRWKLLLAYEALFLILFAAWAWVRSHNPDLWHPVVGGEKPMDFAYLNAVIKSIWFPPYDPWFAGGYINYYYFGFVLVGSLAKLLGVMPSLAYNLALALFYALTGGVTFSVAFNLVGGEVRRRYVAGFLAVLFVLVLGNLGECRLLVNGFRLLAGEPTFQSSIPGLPELVQALKGLGMVLRGAQLPFRPETPYWDPTRMIPPDQSGVGPITEFPAFTFLYGDLHAHMLALPYTLVALALVLDWARGWGRGRAREQVLPLLVGGLVIGSLRAMNTWDYPTYLLLGLAGLALGMAWKEKGWRRELPRLLLVGAALVALTTLMFLPYVRNYIAAYTRVRIWRGPRTPLDIYLLLVGQFLFPLFTLLAGDLRRFLGRADEGRGGMRASLAVGLTAVLLFGLVLALIGLPVAAVVLPALTLTAGLLLESDVSVERRIVWLLTALALGLSLAVEVLVLEGDIGRMNTVFKFYLQVWTSLAVGAAVALVWLDERMERWPTDAWQAWWVVMGVLIASMALFPAMSIPAKLKDRIVQTEPTLDGMAYMASGRVWDVQGEVDLGPDYRAVVWLQENAEGSPVVLEGLGAREYLWGNRVSVYTGLPSVIGWRWHQVQQRMAGGAGQVERRQLEVNECYNTLDTARARSILEKYGVRYVYIGPYERLYYDPRGLSKFGTMDGLRLVYNRDGVKIYEVVQ